MRILRSVVLASITVLLIGLRALPQQLPRSEPLPINEVLATLSFSGFPLSLCPGDEQWIAYQLYDIRRWTRRAGKYGDLTANGVPTLGAGGDIWLTNINTGQSRNLTAGLGSNWALSWSPNGRYLAFYSDRDGRAAVWLWEKATGQLRKLSPSIPRPFLYGYDTPNWTPDSKKILVKLFPDDETFKRLVADTKPRKSTGVIPEIYHSTADPKRAETPPTLRTDVLTVDEVPDFKADLALINVSDGIITPVAKGYVPAGYRLSPDGKRVAFLNAKGAGKTGAAFDLMVVSLTTNKSSVLVSDLNQGSLGDRLTWSPDSALIVYLSTPNWFLVSADGGSTRSVTETTHPPFKAWEQLPLWSTDGRWLYFFSNDSVWKIGISDGVAHKVGEVKGKRLQFIVPNGEGKLWTTSNGGSIVLGIRDDATKQTGFSTMNLGSGEVQPLFEEDKEIRRPAWVIGSTSGNAVYYISQDTKHPSDIWALQITADNSRRRITRTNAALDQYLMGESQLIEWAGSDGTRLRGVLLLPAGYRKGQRYPLIVNVYGGSMLSERKNLFGLAANTNVNNQQIWATRGYAVLLPDTPLRVGTPMLDLAKTVLPGVDKVIEMGIADPERLGVWGASYGGYSTLALLVQTGRFKVAAIDSGFANLLSLYGWMPDRSNEPSWQDWAEISQGRMGGSPWQFRERYLENSPVLYLDRVQTPLLIIQGAKDAGAKDFYSNEIFMNLQRLGKEATYLKYREGGHTLSSFNYFEQVDAVERMLSWFDSHLKNSQQESR